MTQVRFDPVPYSSKAAKRFSGTEDSDVARIPKPGLGRKQAQLATRRGGLPGMPPPDHVVSDGGQRARAELYAGANNHYREINRSWTLTWLRHRMREYVNIHGYASSGVCALLERAAEQYADSDYLRATAASAGNPDATALKQASQHAANARSHELAAWELAAREGVMRRQLGDNESKLSSLARGLRSEAADSKPGSWDGGLTAEGVDAGAIEALPSPFAPPGGVEGPGPPFPPQAHETGSMPTALANPPLPLSPEDEAKLGSPTYCTRCEQKFAWQGSPRCPECERSAFAAPPASVPVAAPKRPLYLYCEPCKRNFLSRGVLLHCPRCGVLSELPAPAPPPKPPQVSPNPWKKCSSSSCLRFYRNKIGLVACPHCGAPEAGAVLPEQAESAIVGERELPTNEEADCGPRENDR